MSFIPHIDNIVSKYLISFNAIYVNVQLQLNQKLMLPLSAQFLSIQVHHEIHNIQLFIPDWKESCVLDILNEYSGTYT